MRKVNKKKDNVNTIISPKFSMEMKRKMREMGDMNPMQLAQELQHQHGSKSNRNPSKLKSPYDHIRKIYNGQIFPGEGALQNICKYLDLDPDEMREKIEQDRAVYKGYAGPFTGKDPLLLQLASYWEYLSELDRDEILAQVQYRAELQTKRHGSGGR